jgi:hypothetical protein
MDPSAVADALRTAVRRFAVAVGAVHGDERRRTFDRTFMSSKADSQGVLVEGYWRRIGDDDDGDPYPVPRPNADHHPWLERDCFLRKIREIEARLTAAGPPGYVRYRGLAPSRVEAGATVGNGEFEDRVNGVCWPEGYAAHYVDKHRVLPSEEFYEYVMGAQLNAAGGPPVVLPLSDWRERWAARRRRQRPETVKSAVSLQPKNRTMALPLLPPVRVNGQTTATYEWPSYDPSHRPHPHGGGHRSKIVHPVPYFGYEHRHPHPDRLRLKRPKRTRGADDGLGGGDGPGVVAGPEPRDRNVRLRERASGSDWPSPVLLHDLLPADPQHHHRRRR